VKEDPSAANLLLLLLLEGTFSIVTALKKYSSLPSPATFLVLLELNRVSHHVVALKELGDLFFSSLEGQPLQS